MLDIKLTNDQQKVVDALQIFFDDPQEQIFTLEGIAGTGKTTLLKEVVRGRANVIACCVSHVAKSILIENMGQVASCITVAQLLGLKMVILDDGTTEFLPRPSKMQVLPIETADIIIVDEASMINDETFGMIMSMKRPHCKVVFSGDPSQLPPISKKDKKDKDSKAFEYTKARLIKTLRYEGVISDLGSRIRTEIGKLNNGKAGTKFIINNWCTELGYSSRTSLVDEDGKGIVFLNNINDVVRLAKRHFQSEEVNELRLIGYRRESIDTLNGVLRAQLYAKKYAKDYDVNVEEEDDEIKLPQFIPGELIISDGGYKDLIHNNQTFRVVGFEEVKGPNDIECLALELDPMPKLREGQQIIVVDDHKGRRKYNKHLKELSENANKDTRQWPQYHEFKQKFASFERSLAINAHRCQGSTYNNVIIFENDILSITKNTIKNKLQSLYVACTRAKKRIYIYNNKYRVDQSLIPEKFKNELGL